MYAVYWTRWVIFRRRSMQSTTAVASKTPPSVRDKGHVVKRAAPINRHYYIDIFIDTAEYTDNTSTEITCENGYQV